MFLVDIGCDRNYPLMVDAVDLAKTTGNLELGDGTQGNQAISSGDKKLTKYVCNLAVRFGQLDSDVIVFVAFPEGGNLYAVEGDL